MHDYWRLISKLTFQRLFNLIQIGLNYVSLKLLKKDIFKSLPFALTIEPTNICNLKCPQCYTGLNNKPGIRGMMPVAFFNRIIDTYYKKIIMVQLHFRGESMIHPDLFNMIQYAVSKKIYTSLYTNGHFLLKNLDNILNSKLDHLNISLDGLSKDVYIKYRRQGDFDLVMKGIIELTNLKKLNKREDLRITLQMLVSNHNKDQVPDFMKLKKIPGINACLLKTMQIIDSNTCEEFVPKEVKLQRRFRKNINKVCLKTLTTIVYTWDGKVLPCCYDKFDEFVLNNFEIMPQKMLGKTISDFRRKLYNHKQNTKMCMNCEEISRDIYIEVY